jgi:hypothetical protein
MVGLCVCRLLPQLCRQRKADTCGDLLPASNGITALTGASHRPAAAHPHATAVARQQWQRPHWQGMEVSVGAGIGATAYRDLACSWVLGVSQQGAWLVGAPHTTVVTTPPCMSVSISSAEVMWT